MKKIAIFTFLLFLPFYVFSQSNAEKIDLIDKLIHKLENEIILLKNGQKNVNGHAIYGFDCPEELLTGDDLKDQFLYSGSRIRVIQEAIKELEDLKNYYRKKDDIIHIDTTDMFDMEYDTDRPGLDYKNFDLPYAEPMLCQQACLDDPKCKAWTYVKPNTIQGPNPRCWLKYAVPQPHHATCCISGVKVDFNQEKYSSPFKNSPYTENWFHNWQVIKIPRDSSGAIGKIYNSNEQFGWKKPVKRIGDAMPPAGANGAALYLHPVSQNEPTILQGRYHVSSPNQALLFRVAGNTNGDWLMVVNINGIKKFEKTIDGKGWYDIEIPVGEYYGQDISVGLHVKANGWFFEYAFIDEIRLKNLSGSSVNFRYLGCYKDSGDPNGTAGRDLNGLKIYGNDMTVEKCIKICAEKGFRYAGLQYSAHCFCGNSYGKLGKANNCNMKCAGDYNQVCGGTWANSVYEILLPHIQY